MPKYRQRTWPSFGSRVARISQVACAFSAFAFSCLAQENPATVCREIAAQISHETAIPQEILFTLLRVKPEREPLSEGISWPWGINIEGQGVWFDTERQAKAHVFRHFMSGLRDFDVGCFQLNYQQHSHAFNSLEEMFDPVKNGRRAAEYLIKLNEEYGDWNRSVQAFQARSKTNIPQYFLGFVMYTGRDRPTSNDRTHKPAGALFGNAPPANTGSLMPLSSPRSAGFLPASAKAGN